MVKFQYISDIHLEFYTNTNIFKKIIKIDDCENICLLGDIGYPDTPIYKSFIKYCSNTWKNVFLTYGNHELYRYNTRKSPIKTIDEINMIPLDFPKNVYFLNNKSVYINKLTNNVTFECDETNDNYIKIIGSLLWSDINDHASLYMNDYNYIYTKYNKLLTPTFSRNLFYKNKEFILNEIKCNFKCLILTHHGTHELCDGIYSESELKSAFATHIPEIYESDNIIACLYGHTHHNVNLHVNGVKLLSNCYGYKNENQKFVKYNCNAIFEII